METAKKTAAQPYTSAIKATGGKAYPAVPVLQQQPITHDAQPAEKMKADDTPYTASQTPSPPAKNEDFSHARFIPATAKDVKNFQASGQSEPFVVQRAEIVGVKEDAPHPTQGQVNRFIVEHKEEALATERYPLSYVVANGQRAGAGTTFVSDGHHAYVAAQRADQEIPRENIDVGQSELTWRDVTYSEDEEWFDGYLRDGGKVSLDRADALRNATTRDELDTAWDALNGWEKTAISDESGMYEDVWDAVEENNLTDDLHELAGEEQGEEEEEEEEDE